MTAVTSEAKTKNSFFAVRYKDRISEGLRLFIVNIVMGLIGLPVLTLIMVYGFYLEQQAEKLGTEKARLAANSYEPYGMIVVSVIAIFITVFSGVVAVHGVYNYLYKKSVADMNYSLPLNTKQRYFADYLAGFTIYIAPAVCSVILSLIIYGISNIFIEMKEPNEIFGNLLMCISIVIVAMILFYSLCTFAVTWAGSTFEAIFSSLASNALIPAIIACAWFLIVSTSGYGLDEEAILYNQFFTSSSPIGSAVFFFYFVEEGGLESSSDPYINSIYIRWIVSTLICSLVFTLGGYLLYKFRKAEDVSKPYVYKGFYYLMLSGAVFCILSLFVSLDEGENIVAGIITCAIGWFIMEIITRRGFKRFWTAGIGFACTVGAVFGICGICNISDGFGTSRYVPLPVNISKVSIYMNNGDTPEIVFKDRDVINACIDLQKNIIDRHYNPKNYTYKVINENKISYDETVFCDETINITYYTRTGSTIKRNYSFATSLDEELAKAMVLSDEYAEKVKEYAVNKNYDYDHSKSVITYSTEVKNKLFKSEGTINLSDENAKRLKNAYAEDLKNMTEDDLINGKIVAYLNNRTSAFVLDSFKNTLSFLMEQDVELPEIDREYFSDNNVNLKINQGLVYVAYEQAVYEYGNSYHSYTYDYEKDNLLSEVDNISIMPNSVYRYSPSSLTRVDKKYASDSLIELVENSKPYIFGQNPLAEIVLENGATLYVPNTSHNAELLGKVSYVLKS